MRAESWRNTFCTFQTFSYLFVLFHTCPYVFILLLTFSNLLGPPPTFFDLTRPSPTFSNLLQPPLLVRPHALANFEPLFSDFPDLSGETSSLRKLLLVGGFELVVKMQHPWMLHADKKLYFEASEKVVVLRFEVPPGKSWKSWKLEIRYHAGPEQQLPRTPRERTPGHPWRAHRKTATTISRVLEPYQVSLLGPY